MALSNYELIQTSFVLDKRWPDVLTSLMNEGNFDHVVEHIFLFLDVCDLRRCLLVNKRWNGYVTDLWMGSKRDQIKWDSYDRALDVQLNQPDRSGSGLLQLSFTPQTELCRCCGCPYYPQCDFSTIRVGFMDIDLKAVCSKCHEYNHAVIPHDGLWISPRGFVYCDLPFKRVMWNRLSVLDVWRRHPDLRRFRARPIPVAKIKEQLRFRWISDAMSSGRAVFTDDAIVFLNADGRVQRRLERRNLTPHDRDSYACFICGKTHRFVTSVEDPQRGGSGLDSDRGSVGGDDNADSFDQESGRGSPADDLAVADDLEGADDPWAVESDESPGEEADHFAGFFAEIQTMRETGLCDRNDVDVCSDDDLYTDEESKPDVVEETDRLDRAMADMTDWLGSLVQ